MSQLTSPRTLFPPDILLLLCLSLLQVTGISSPLMFASSTHFECMLLDLSFENPGSKSLRSDNTQLIGPCFQWHLWSGDEQIEDGRVDKGGVQGEVSMAWSTVAYLGEARRCRVWGSPRSLCARRLSYFERKNMCLSHFWAFLVQTPAVVCLRFSVTQKQEYTESLTESDAGETYFRVTESWNHRLL